jgi:serine/threonine protein kinase
MVSMQSTSERKEVLSEIGGCQLVAELARGETANVFLATLAGFNKLVVLKQLRPALAEDADRVAVFLEEARLAAKLDHPNVPRAADFGSDGQRHYMTMEFLDGRTFDRFGLRLVAHGRLSVGGCLRIVADSLLGLQYAHGLRGDGGAPMGLVHRAFDPHHVFVTFAGDVKVLQLGRRQAKGALRRVAYMAPEQAWRRGIDRRADVYSAGAMIWEIAAGRRLWPGLSEVETLARVLREGIPPLSSVQPDATDDLEAICARATARDRDRRYDSASELYEALEAHLALRDDQMTTREIGDVLGRVFARERRQLVTLLEEALRLRAVPRSSRPGPSLAPNGEPDDGGTAWTERISTPDPAEAASTPPPLPELHTDQEPMAPLLLTRRRGFRWFGREGRLMLAAFAAGALLVSAAVTPVPGASRGAAAIAPPLAPATEAPPAVTAVPVSAPEVPSARSASAAAPVRRTSAPRASSARPPGAPSRPPATRALPPPALPIATATPPSPPVSASSSTTAAGGALQVDPAGGRVPHRPIVTDNPYGAR